MLLPYNDFTPEGVNALILLRKVSSNNYAQNNSTHYFIPFRLTALQFLQKGNNKPV